MYKNILYGLAFTILIVSLSFLYILKKTVPQDFFQVIYSIDKKYLFLSLCAFFCFHTFDNLRIFTIARSIGLRYSFFYGYLISFVSSFGATVTPFHLGGELLPFYTLRRVKGEVYKIMSIITLKGIFGLFFYILFFPFTIQSLLNNPREAKEILLLLTSILLITIFIIFLWQLIFKRSVKLLSRSALIKTKYTVLKYFVVCKNFFKEKQKVFIVVLFFSISMYSALLFTGIFLVKAFNHHASAKEVFFAQLPLIYAIFISPTPGGSGVGELGALSVFDKFVISKLLGVFAILWRIISQYLSAVIGGILFFIIVIKDINKKND